MSGMLTIFHGGAHFPPQSIERKRELPQPTTSQASAHSKRVSPARFLSNPDDSNPYAIPPPPAEGHPMRRAKNSSPRETASLHPHSIPPPPAERQPVRRGKISSPQETAQLDPQPAAPLFFRTTAGRAIFPAKLRSSDQPPGGGGGFNDDVWLEDYLPAAYHSRTNSEGGYMEPSTAANLCRNTVGGM